MFWMECFQSLEGSGLLYPVRFFKTSGMCHPWFSNAWWWPSTCMYHRHFVRLYTNKVHARPIYFWALPLNSTRVPVLTKMVMISLYSISFFVFFSLTILQELSAGRVIALWELMHEYRQGCCPMCFSYSLPFPIIIDHVLNEWTTHQQLDINQGSGQRDPMCPWGIPSTAWVTVENCLKLWAENGSRAHVVVPTKGDSWYIRWLTQ